MEQSSIPFCPVVKPKFKEFNDFRNFVETLDAKYKNLVGMVKVTISYIFRLWKNILSLFQSYPQVVPPKQWIPRMHNYQQKLENLIVYSPIEQNAFGKGGIYECLHIPKKSLTLEEYKQKAIELDKITDGKSVEQVELMFWKNIAFSPPLYGADILNTLMDEKSKGWNLNNLDSILMEGLSEKVKGVNTPYCYVGSWKALFCWHTEDLDLSAINFLHYGKPKFWYAIHEDDRYILQNEAKKILGQHFASCNQFLRHKTTLINPYYLKKKYPNLRISKQIQYENQFILVFGGCYHSGFNFGYNMAEAVNYATLDWLRQLPMAKSCKCMSKSVKASLYQVYANLVKNPQLSKKPQFIKFQQHVFDQAEKQQSQQQFEETKKGVKDIWTKKIKKTKKSPKTLIYKNEEYEIDNWIQCEKCNIWRKVPHNENILLKRVQLGQKFNCKKLSKECFRKDKIDKNLFTLAVNSK